MENKSRWKKLERGQKAILIIWVLFAAALFIGHKYSWDKFSPAEAYSHLTGNQDLLDAVRFLRESTKAPEAWSILFTKDEDGDFRTDVYAPQAVAMAPDNWGILHMAGKLNQMNAIGLIRTEPEKAAAILAEADAWQVRALEINPQCRGCFWMLTVSAQYRGDWESMERHSQSLLEMSKPASQFYGWALRDLGMARLKLGDLEGALDAANQAIEREDNPRLRFFRACLLEYHLHDPERAAVDWERSEGHSYLPHAQACQFEHFHLPSP